jgi:hypothetical protein
MSLSKELQTRVALLEKQLANTTELLRLSEAELNDRRFYDTNKMQNIKSHAVAICAFLEED